MSNIYLGDLSEERRNRIISNLEAKFGELGPMNDWTYNQIRHLAYCLPDATIVLHEYIEHLREME